MDASEATERAEQGESRLWLQQRARQRALLEHLETRGGRLPETSLDLRAREQPQATGPEILGPPDLDAKTDRTLQKANINVADPRTAEAEAARIESRQVSAPVTRVMGPDVGGPAEDGEGFKVSGELREMREIGGLTAGTAHGTETTDGAQVTTSIDAISVDDGWHGLRTRRARGADRDPMHDPKRPTKGRPQFDGHGL